MDNLSKRGVELKHLDETGHGLARIATLSEVDHDGDTYERGAFGEQWAQILAAHNWSTVPLGKARVYEADNEALAELHFNMDSVAGREWFSSVKFDFEGCCEGAPKIQEWSYGFRVIDSADETRDDNRVRVLKRLEVFEVSPVVKGAGIGTGTLDIKSTNTNFGDQLDGAIAEMGDIVVRARSIKDLRNKDGRGLSATRITQLTDLNRGIVQLLDEAEAEKRLGENLYAQHIARQIGREV